MIDHRLLLSSCILPLCLAAAPAAAQEAGATEADDGGLDTIVVTAQRREEKLQDIPVAVSAFSEQTIERLRLTDALSTSKFVPGMISQHNAGLGSANAYYLRGLGNSQSTPTFDAPVTTYVNDVYIARQNANNYAFFDTERVEILRGPQGTLFGRNTTGGAVHVILRKPKDTFGVKAEVTAGSYERYTGKATVDLPISETVLTKVSGFYISDRGYMRNITTNEWLNGEKNWGVRGDVRLLPAEAVTIDLSAEYTSNSGTYSGMRNVAGGANNPYVVGATTSPVYYESAAGLARTDCGDNNVNILLNTGKGSCNLSKNVAVGMNISVDTGNGSIEYIVGYRRLKQGYINQYDATTTNKYAGYILVDNGTHKQWSNELKYNTRLLDNRINLVTGLFYLKETSDDRQTAFTGGTTSFVENQDQHLLPETETAAFYAQADFDVTDQLKVTAGGRYTWERKTVNYLASPQFTTAGASGYTGAQVAALGIPLEQTFRKFTPRVAVSYKVNPDFMLFASATNGFKSGGWNGGARLPQDAVVFAPEKTWSFEGGFKSEFFDNKARVNVTAYYARTTDLQVTAGVTRPDPLNPTVTIISQIPFNAGTFVAYGVEVESSARIGDLQLFANPSFMRGEYTYIVPTSQRLTTGYVPTRVPTFQFSGGATYEVPVPALGGKLGATATWRHNSPYWVAVLNTTHTTFEDFVDASVSYTTDDDRYSLSFEVSNLTKQRTVTANFLSLFPGDPRRFTARFRAKM